MRRAEELPGVHTPTRPCTRAPRVDSSGQPPRARGRGARAPVEGRPWRSTSERQCTAPWRHNPPHPPWVDSPARWTVLDSLTRARTCKKPSRPRVGSGSKGLAEGAENGSALLSTRGIVAILAGVKGGGLKRFLRRIPGGSELFSLVTAVRFRALGNNAVRRARGGHTVICGQIGGPRMSRDIRVVHTVRATWRARATPRAVRI